MKVVHTILYRLVNFGKYGFRSAMSGIETT